MILPPYRFRGRRTLRLFLFLLTAFALPLVPAHADDIRDLFDSAGHPHISLGMTTASRRNIVVQQGSFAQQTTNIAAAIPFAGSMNDGSSLWSFHASLRAAAADVSLFPAPVTLFSARAGISNRIFNGSDDYYFFAAVGFASDDDALDVVRWRFSGTGLATHALSRCVALHYGLVYSYSLGRGLLLPLAGVRWSPSDRWSIRAVLPISIHAAYRADERWSFGAGIALDGDRFQFTNDGRFAAAPRQAYLRLSQIECGADLNLRFSALLSVSGEAGVALARRLWISSDNGDYFSTRISSGGYARAVAHFSL